MLIAYRLAGERKDRVCFTRNLSVNGLLLEVTERIPPSTALAMTCHMPIDRTTRTRQDIRLHATVQWVEQQLTSSRPPQRLRYLVGVTIDWMDSRDQESWTEYVTRRLSQSTKHS